MGFSYNMAVHSKEVYNSQKTRSKVNASLSVFRDHAHMVRLSALQKRKELEDKFAEIRAEYSVAKSNKMIAELEQTHKEYLKKTSEELVGLFNEIMNAKRTAIKQYTLIPPSDKTLRLFEALDRRDKSSISDVEWQYLLEATAGNYQEMSMLAKVAKDIGKDFVLPFAPDTELEKLDEFQKLITPVLSEIGTPDKKLSTAGSIFYLMDGMTEGYHDHTKFRAMIDDLDTSAATAVPDIIRSLYDRLLEAKQKALDHGQYNLYNKIRDLVDKYSDQLQSAAEKQERINAQAEDLLLQASKIDEHTLPDFKPLTSNEA